MDLEVAGADRRLDAVPVAAGLVERPRDRRLADAEEAEHASAAAARRARARAAPARSRGRCGQSRRSSPGGPGRTTTRSPSCRGRAGRRAGEPERDRALGQRRLLATPAAKSAYGRRSRSATMRETRSISPRARRRGRARPASDARDELDRAVVVRRAEAARDDAAGRRAAPSRSASSSSSGPSPTTRCAPARAQREQPAGEERAVQIGPLAADELAARDDDRRPRAAHGPSTRARPVRRDEVRRPLPRQRGAPPFTASRSRSAAPDADGQAASR